MTHRERLEARRDRREEWAQKARQRSDQHAQAAHQMADGIPFGQPILAGHHSEGRDRRYRERIGAHSLKSVEQADLADHHRNRADGLARQLERSIFSDDEDAVEQLKAKVAALEAKRDQMKADNAAKRVTLPLCNYRATEVVALNKYHGTYDLRMKQVEMAKAEYGALHTDRRGTQTVAGTHRVRCAIIRGGEMVAVFLTDAKVTDPPAEAAPADAMPAHEGWELTNLGAQIRQAKARIEEIRAAQQRTAAAEAAGGVTVEGEGEYVRVTFAEKPERETLDALKAAAFRWSQGSWWGRRDALPAVVAAK